MKESLLARHACKVGRLELILERFETLEGETADEQLERVRGIVERMLDGG